METKYRLTLFTSGFNSPRGLKFGPDGFLYVAEGGSGGTNSTAGQCAQVPPPVGPYTGGKTARISKVSPRGERVTLVDGLPSNATSANSGGLVSGVADVAFAGDRLYALLGGGGCSHGNPEVPNGIIAVDPGGTWQMLADLSAFLSRNPVVNPDPEDDEPDGTWYSLIFFDGYLYALDPHFGEIDCINLAGAAGRAFTPGNDLAGAAGRAFTPGNDLAGAVSRFVDISASQGHIVPTALCEFRGDFYVGSLSRFPLQPGAAKILKITLGGEVSVFQEGLNNITGLLSDAQGRFYVLESNVGVPFPTRDTGRLVRIARDGTREVLVTGLSEPAAMIFGPDGSIYISNKGYGYPPGEGEIVRVEG